MTRINFACVNFNSSKYTIEYISSILSLETMEYFIVKIFIIDNCSEIEDYKIIEKYVANIENVQLMRTELNVGYFGGLNIAISFNRSAKDYWVIGNNDVTFPKLFLSNLKRVLSNGIDSDVLVLSPNIINLDNVHQNPVSVNRLSLKRRIFLNVYFFNYYIGIPLYFVVRKIKSIMKLTSRNNWDSEQKIILGYGACYVLLPSFFRYFNKLDDEIFLYGEEALLSHQVQSVNGSILYCPTLEMRHYEHATVSSIESKKHFKITQSAYKIYKKYL